MECIKTSKQVHTLIFTYNFERVEKNKLYERIGQSVYTIAFTNQQQIRFLLRGVVHIKYASSTLCASKLKNVYFSFIAVFLLERIPQRKWKRGRNRNRNDSRKI
jgi:hypothetical protein